MRTAQIVTARDATSSDPYGEKELPDLTEAFCLAQAHRLHSARAHPFRQMNNEFSDPVANRISDFLKSSSPISDIDIFPALAMGLAVRATLVDGTGEAGQQVLHGLAVVVPVTRKSTGQCRFAQQPRRLTCLFLSS